MTSSHRRALVRAFVALGLAAAVVAVPGCWPGRCGGGLRSLQPGPASVRAGAVIEATPGTAFWINVDTNERSGAALLAASGVTSRAVVLDGPHGPVPVAVSAKVIESAHSCASAGTIDIQPVAPLAPGTYVLAVLLDEITWPAIFDGDVETWQGRRALIRRYVVK